MATTKGAWKLQEVRDQILAGAWVEYDSFLDPGTLWAWGNNTYGELGQNNTIHRSSPVQIPGLWLNTCGGINVNFATKTDGTLWAWGGGALGRRGTNDTIARSSPIQIPGTNWICATSGFSNASFGLKGDGTLWAWGTNASGQLGQNNTIYRSSPVQIPGTNWCDLAGAARGAAIKTDGTLWTWGPNYRGILGDNTTISRSSPIQIPGTQWSRVVSAYNIAAFKTDGSLWVWGGNFSGDLGLNRPGVTGHLSSPVQLPGSWTDIAIFVNSTVGKKIDGTLWSWGQNDDGELGQNDSIRRSSPVQIPGINWNRISSSGGRKPFATKTDGTLWGWGDGRDGRLGNNAAIPRSSPVQIPGTTWLIGKGGYTNTIGKKST